MLSATSLCRFAAVSCLLVTASTLAFFKISMESSFMISPFHYGLFPVHQFNTLFNLLRTCINSSLILVLINMLNVI